MLSVAGRQDASIARPWPAPARRGWRMRSSRPVAKPDLGIAGGLAAGRAERVDPRRFRITP